MVDPVGIPSCQRTRVLSRVRALASIPTVEYVGASPGPPT